MQFSAIPGQTETKSRLINLVASNRLSHALLFLGKEGSGALMMAIAFAQYIVCEKNKPKKEAADDLFGASSSGPDTFLDDACGTCPSCKKAHALIHPDIHFSFPTITTEKSNKPVCNDFITEWRSFIAQTPFGNDFDWLQHIQAENKQGNITVHECEDIARKLNLKSFESGYKILIQWMPEYLRDTGNKLLKLIEEPPEKTLLILVAGDESRILPTILSRTQLVKINRIDPASIREWLIGSYAVPKEKAVQVSLMCNGNMREALQILQEGAEDWQELLREWLNAILKNGPASQVKWVEEISKLGREKQKQFLGYFEHLVSIAVRFANGQTAVELPEKEMDFANRLLKIAATEQLMAIVGELDKSAYQIERNANPKILFMALTIKIYHIIRDKSVILVH